ncbi:MAG TPA: hypothetical protein VF756_31460 [Thermoanaerobaculia bacterium]
MRSRAVLALLVAVASSAAAAELPRGQVVDKVACVKDPGKTYALYLPSGYRPDRKWPVVYAFDSRGNGKEIAELLRTGAERYGWIVVSSYNSSHQIPMEENFKTMSALWADTHARLSIDDRRVYAMGFSGLVRFVCMLGLTAPESLAGVIGANGGFPLGHPPTRQTPFPFFFTVGNKDFSYYELLDLDQTLSSLGLPHRLEVFEGSHEWPPEELFTQGIAWMELQAMKRGLREKSAAVVDPLWSQDLARARSLDGEGRLYEAFRAYSSLAADFKGLRKPEEMAEVERKLAEMKASKALQQEIKEREARDRRDREYLEKVPRIFDAAPAEIRPDSVSQILSDLKIPELKKRAQSDPDPDERLSAERLLYAVYIQTGLYLPREYSRRQQYDRAIFLLQVAAEIDPDVPHIPFRLATAYANKGNRKKALDYLALSVDKGWTDLVALEGERAFDPLRQSEEYKTIVAQLLRKQKEAGQR